MRNPRLLSLLFLLLLLPTAAWADSEPAPFGANLFQGNFSQAKANDAREVGAGDRLVLRLWGARNFDDVLTEIGRASCRERV